MATAKTILSAKERFNKYLTTIAIDEYNGQLGTKLNPDDFDLIRLANNDISAIAYEVRAVNIDPKFRIRVYLSLGNMNDLGPFTRDLDSSYVEGLFGDEIMVSYGTMDVQGIRNEGYNIKAWLEENQYYDIILLEDFGYLLAEDGLPFLLEIAV